MAESMSIATVLHPHHTPGLQKVLERNPDLQLITPIDASGVIEELAGGAPVLITFHWDDRFLLPGLRWVQALSAGVEQFPLDDFRRSGVVLSSARGAHGPAVAEHAIALLMALTRSVGTAARASAARRWDDLPGYELAGRTLGVLGLGSIGEEVAKRAFALGMKVVGTKRDPATYQGVADRVWGPDGTLEVCRVAEVLVLALPETTETSNLVGRAQLEALGEGWLVNVARGSIVDEDALVDALESGSLRGAGLDVFTEEPLPDTSPLWDLPNVVITPHMAWASDRLVSRLDELIKQNLRAFRGEAEWATRIT